MTDIDEANARTGLDPQRLSPNYFKLFWASTISNLGDGIGLIAYPWLASAVTRNPLLISMVVVVQRLPWLLFSLPAGVITDRHDRKRLMVTSNTIRAIVTIGIAAIVMARQGALRARRRVRRRHGDHDRHDALPPDPGGHPPPRHRRGAVRQLGADVPAVDRPHRPAGEGERSHVECRTRRQHLRRSTAGGAAHRRVVCAALLRRRRHVRRLGAADCIHPTSEAHTEGRRSRCRSTPRRRRGEPNSSRASDGCGATTCCEPWRSRSGCST